MSVSIQKEWSETFLINMIKGPKCLQNHVHASRNENPLKVKN